MFNFKKVTIIALGIVLLFLSACSKTGGAGLPGTGPLGTAVGTQFSLENPPKAVLDAQTWLANQLGVSVENTKLLNIQKTEFSDSCLGLGGPAESCAQVMTPGWTVTAEVNGQQYEVRASEDGSVVRMVGGTPSVTPSATQ
jgi:hypothetical protein